VKFDLSSAGVNTSRACGAVIIFCLTLDWPNRADTIELINGDRYSGTVLSVTLSNVSLRSEIQGLVVLPRDKVGTIAFNQTTAKTNSLQTKTTLDGKIATVTPPPATLAQPGISTNSSNLVARVQDQLLAGSGPEATQKYNQMATDFLSGKMSLSDLRKQAQETLMSMEQAKKDLGPEVGDVVDSYLSILRDFLQESPQK
jgi:hypothetical protein